MQGLPDSIDPLPVKDVSICNLARLIPKNFVTPNYNRTNGSAWHVVNDPETQSSPTASPSTLPSVPVCVASVTHSRSVESWCLGDAVIGAWRSHRKGMLKMPLADATVKIFDFPAEHEPFILKTP